MFELESSAGEHKHCLYPDRWWPTVVATRQPQGSRTLKHCLL